MVSLTRLQSSWGCSWLMAQPLSRLFMSLLEDLKSSLASIQRHPSSSTCHLLYRACSTAASFHHEDQWWTDKAEPEICQHSMALPCSLLSLNSKLDKQWKYFLKIELRYLLGDSTQWSWNSESSRPMVSRQSYLLLMFGWGMEEGLTSLLPLIIY